jgi:hypothetical protein
VKALLKNSITSFIGREFVFFLNKFNRTKRKAIDSQHCGKNGIS